MIANRQRAQLAILFVAACFYGVFIARTAFSVGGKPHFTLIDDAMISMRYAQHLAAGQGLVWNIGGPPVQGFSNPGWVLLMALFHLLPLSPGMISLGIMLTGTVILVATAFVLARICYLLAPEASVAALMAASIGAFYFPLVFWSLRGMEVGALVLLISLASAQAFSMRPTSRGRVAILGLLLAAAVVIRLDAALQAALILLYVAITGRLPRAQLVLLVALVGLAMAGVLAFQRIYFGEWLPNTYYQKLGGGSIVERIRAGLLAFYLYGTRDVLTMAVVATAGLWLYKDLRSQESALLVSLFVVQCLYSIWVGGDYAEPEVAAANRFIAQGVPALIVLFSIVINRAFMGLASARRWGSSAWQDRSWLLAIPMAVATLALISGAPWTAWAIENAPLLRADIRRVRAGLAIAASTSEDVTIAVHAAGQIPYYSGRRAIDLLGLNDPLVAKGPRRTGFYPGHDKWNYEHSIGELKPDLIADNWIRLADYMKGKPEYRKLENGMYVRVDTTLVDEAALSGGYP